jgi:hypothetical protein
MENACGVYSDAKTTRTGLAFFATPHNGGREDLVALGAFASNIATFLGWKKGDNIIQTLKSGSLFTALLQDHWRHRLDQFNVVSFRGAEDDVGTLAPITTTQLLILHRRLCLGQAPLLVDLETKNE